jgi:hypothetical protein
MSEWIVKKVGRYPLAGIWILVLLLNAGSVSAQLAITSPVNNLVMQRNATGNANISITAYTYCPYTRITAALSPIEGNTSPSQQQDFPPAQLIQGFLYTTFTIGTGWYKLTLTGTASDGHTDTASVARVGVGEVFLVTGNSNAMGLPGLGSKDASSNIISFNAVNKILNSENITVAPDSPMPVPQFAALKAGNYIFPNGEASWYWGELGDILFKRWKTPVLFFNAAWAAANSENYRDAASGKDAFNLYVNKYWPNRQPYSNIVNTLRYMTSITGIRAVLWSHGENDAQLGFKENDYFNYIRTLIQNSRRDTGYPVPWFIARNSASNALKDPHLPVLNAQNRLIALQGFNTFQGPYLDTIQMPRPASGHFENVAGGVQGLTVAATAWARSLADSTITKVVPVQPAYTLHAGVTPAYMYPSASFTLPYYVEGNAPDTLRLHAELLNEQGEYVETVGSGSSQPLPILIPSGLANGNYRIRIVGDNPVFPGSISEPFQVNSSYKTIEYVNQIAASHIGQDIRVSWLLAPVPGLQQMVLQKTTDGTRYSDLQTFTAPTPGQSGVFGFTDSQPGDGTIFYRVQMVYTNGNIAHSTIVTVFQNGAPEPWTVFPNPVTQQQFFIRPSEELNVQCRLFDVAGREHPIFTSEREAVGLISVRPQYALPAGKYVLQMVTDSQTKTQSIVFN